MTLFPSPPAELKAALADRYRLDRELGQGGMATVYLAHDLKHDRDVALKVLRPELAAVLGAERFLREIQLTAKLQHPHIVTLIDSGEAGGGLYYVLPYIEGESLRQRLEQEKQLSIDDALRLTTEIAEALDYAHQQGVIHRDIKPENILLSRGHALVADFGIALAVTQAGGGRLTETGLSLGTPAYMSPEQAMAEPDLDARTDQYSLACVLYEMLAGEPPYSGPTAQAIIAKRLREPVPHLSTIREVPAPIEVAVTRALSKSRADRFGGIGEFAAALTSRPASRKLAASRRAIFAAFVAVALLTLAVVAALRWPGQKAGLDPRRVVVAVFENRAGDRGLDDLGLTIADYISRGLLNTGLVTVGDLGTLYLRGRDSAGAPADPRELARRQGAGLVILGSYSRIGDSLELAAKAIDVATGSLRQAFEPVRSPLSNPTQGLGLLQNRVVSGLATVIDPHFSTFTTTGTTPPTYAAYQAFAEGQARFWKEGPDSATLALFRRATAQDTTFLAAAVWLAFASGPGGQCDVTDSISQALSQSLDRLARLDRLNLEWSNAYCRADGEELYRIARASATLQPNSGFAKYWVALWALYSNRPRETVEILSALDRSRDLEWLPDSAKTVYFRDLTNALHVLGRFGPELKAARDYRAREPRSIAGRFMEARALAGMGRGDEVLLLLDSARGLPDDPILWEVHRTDELYAGIAFELLAHGDSSAARAAAEQAVADPHGRSRSLFRPGRVEAAMLLGSYDKASQLLDPESKAGSVRYLGRSAQIALLMGESRKADSLDGVLARWNGRSSLHRFALCYRAEFAAMKGDRGRALALLREAKTSYEFGTILLHIEPALFPLRGDPAFEEMMRPDR